MKMKMISASLLAALSFASVSAMAATQTVTISGAPAGYTDLSGAVSFDGFDSTLGSLQSVIVTIGAIVTNTAVVYNFDSTAKDGTLSLDVLLGFSTGSVASTSYAGTLYTQAYTVAGDGDYNYFKEGKISASTTFSTGLSYFTTSTVTGTAAISAKSYATGAEGVLPLFSTQAIGSGTVTYVYAPVPEPETYGMMVAGLGLMGLIARRKRAARKA